MSFDPSYAILGAAMFGLFSWAIISSASDRKEMLAEIGPMYDASPTDPEPVIGEPFLEFVRLYKENHRRFLVYRTYLPLSEIDSYYLFDRVTKEQFKISRRRDDYGIWPEGEYIGLDWATTDELDYVVDQLKSQNYQRKVRMEAYRAEKAAKKHLTERDRLKKVYKV